MNRGLAYVAVGAAVGLACLWAISRSPAQPTRAGNVGGRNLPPVLELAYPNLIVKKVSIAYAPGSSHLPGDRHTLQVAVVVKNTGTCDARACTLAAVFMRAAVPGNPTLVAAASLPAVQAGSEVEATFETDIVQDGLLSITADAPTDAYPFGQVREGPSDRWPDRTPGEWNNTFAVPLYQAGLIAGSLSFANRAAD